MTNIKENKNLLSATDIDTAGKLPPAHSVRAPVARGGVPTRERNRVLQHSAIKPLNVMMEVLEERYKLAKAIEEPEARQKAMNEAVAVAEKVAPYLHPKLQATTLKGDPSAPLSFAVSLPDSLLLMAAVRGKKG